MALEHCQNCEHTIGKLERAFVFNNNIVCSECYAKLNKIKGEHSNIRMVKCPYCAEEIQDGSTLCRYCKSNLDSSIPSQPSVTQPVTQVQSTRGDDMAFNIRYMQMKKSVGIALLLNFLWAGSGIYYAKCPEGRFIVWLNFGAFILSFVTFGIPCLALFIWSSIICHNYIQIYNYELLEALRTGKLGDFNKKYALL